MPNASGAFSAAAATNTAAMPTSEWNAATSCGSAVIWMRSATTVPIAAADDDAEEDQAVAEPAPCRDAASVATTATAMPIMPKRLPWREVSGMRQAAQRQDEQDGGDEVGERGQAGGHRCVPYCFFA